jgi:hypothetical protein
LTEPLQEIFSRQDAKAAKKKISSCLSELGALCVFAGVISFPILQADTQLRISNRFGYAAR